MLFHRWHPFSTPLVLSKCLTRPWKLWLLSSITCLSLLLSQSQVLATSTASINVENPLFYCNLIYLAIGVFLASILTIESRRFTTFLMGLFLLLSGLWAIALLLHYNANLPHPGKLWTYGAVGVGIGVVPIGLWWWGQRQGYFVALINLLFCPDSSDPILKRLINYYEIENSGEGVRLGFFKRMNYQAAVVRYYRMLDQGELNALDVLVCDRIQDHWQKKQAEQHEQHKKKKTSAIESLLSQATEHLDKAPL